MKKLLVILISFLFLDGNASSFFAISQIELSLSELCKKSDNIIIAEVVSSRSYMSENRIFTEINLQIVQSIKGTLQTFETLTMTALGGKFNGTTMLVLDTPNFTVGEQSLLFLSRISMPNNKTNYIVTGMSQGKFNIFSETGSNIKKVYREQVGTPLKPEINSAPILLTNINAIPLTDFIIEIRRFLK